MVALGREATKNLSQIVKIEKEYIADIKLGLSSSTDDEEGHKVKSLKVYKVYKVEVEKILKKFVGQIKQVPPFYSAINVNGQRSYKLVRAGKAVELKSRPVEIKSLKILKYKFPNLKIKVVCGPGVYIRSLARDIGKSLSVTGYMSDLKRTRVGQFKISNAISIDDITKRFLADQIGILKRGGIGIIPTDTIYGLVGLALNKKVVERIYKVRRRSPDKPFIILISSFADLKKFGVKTNSKTNKILKKYWPGQVSIILDCDQKLTYLHRGTNSLAFRLPDNDWLKLILQKTGPLVAPSANWEGHNPALTIKQAKRYFSNSVDFYIDRRKLESKPSTLIKIASGDLTVLRQGMIKIS